MSRPINMNWLSSPEGESLLHHFYDHTKKKRRIYGILEMPCLPPSIEEVVNYKIFMVGRDTTSVVARLSGIVGTNIINNDINGIKKTIIYWPIKIWDKIILFKLNFWDTSENSIKKYNHILPACKDKVDAICSVFTFDDVTSFNDIPYLMNSMCNIKDKPANIVIGSKYKPWSTQSVVDGQIKEFEAKWKLKIIKIDVNKFSARPEIFDVSYQLNTICKILWNRDQEFITKQIVQV
ncbi:hypothetical protein HCN44_008270 [Aphidius gifuensis]|uniref:Uncharacterized protein n=1 Tax=Aphidius gifuensis TaxID=684658 RepID=A0A834XRP5_APHGI|nr:ciliogenesis and planar polarity effector 2-like [Aphidius gifuensis]KAF7989596.1 hypothetical protein HCN44_008270 [Aphidius gifuensis]